MAKKKTVKKKAAKKVLKKVAKKKQANLAKKQPIKIKSRKTAPVKAKTQQQNINKTFSIPAGVSLEEVGVVTHYFPKVDAAVAKLTKGSLALGDKIFIKGHTSDFTEKVESIQLDHVAIEKADIGQEIGLKVKSKVREHDVIYKMIG